jgi:hypothetical protein
LHDALDDRRARGVRERFEFRELRFDGTPRVARIDRYDDRALRF